MPSTVIRQIEYEPERQRLLITFLSGRIYAYDRVPQDVYFLFRNARSKGEFFNHAIRDRYPAREVLSDREPRTWAG